MTDCDSEYRTAMAEFKREEKQLDRFLRGLMLLGCIGIIAVIGIGIAHG